MCLSKLNKFDINVNFRQNISTREKSLGNNIAKPAYYCYMDVVDSIICMLLIRYSGVIHL